MAANRDLHPFIALGALAATEQWCWRMFCTTCGHMLFRYALRELAAGRHPCDPGWIVHASHPALYRGLPARELGPIPPLGSWPLEEQRRLASVLRTANLNDLMAKAPGTAWLGYTGLALNYTADAERIDRSLTTVWTPQLRGVVASGSPASQRLSVIGQDASCVLTWRDLELVERSLDIAALLLASP